MDIHGEDTYSFGRENPMFFRHAPMHHMYFNDFKTKEMEDLDALSKHVMKGLNEDDPTSPPLHHLHHTPSNIMDQSSLSSSMKDGSSSSSFAALALKLEEGDDEGELAGSFAFFKKPQLNQYNQLNQSMDDLLPANHHNLHLPQSNKHDFVFLQPFEQRSNGKHNNNVSNGLFPQYSQHNSTNNHINSVNINNITHNGNKSIDSSLAPSSSMAQATIINTINSINNINNINNISHINTYNTINNSININININNNKDDTDNIDDKSAIQLINSTNGNSLEFLDDYITTGSNSSSSSGDIMEDNQTLGDSTAGLTNAMTSTALNNSNGIPTINSNSSTTPNSLHRISSMPTMGSIGVSSINIIQSNNTNLMISSTPHYSTNRLHHSTSSLVPLSSNDAGFSPHPLSSSCNMIKDSDASSLSSSGEVAPIVIAAGGTTVIDGVTYNNRGYEVCGSLNKFNKPCQRIGRCPFHYDSTSPKKSTPDTSSNSPVHERRYLPIKKGPYKSGWKKDEHLRFLKGLQMHGKGSWKEIAQIVGSRTPTQIQVHAHRYYLRQLQETKNKRSIHDISLHDLEELEGPNSSGISLESDATPPQLSPPSPDRTPETSHISTTISLHSPYPVSIPSQLHPLHPSQSSHTTHPTHPHSALVSLTPLSTTLTNTSLHHSVEIVNPNTSPPANSPPISAPSSPTNFSSLFPGPTASSSLPNTLPGLPLLSYPVAPLGYHNSWYSVPTYSINQMSNLNSMTISMNNLGDADMHLPPSSADHKLSSFSQMREDYEHANSHPHTDCHSDTSSPEEEFSSNG